MWEMTLEVRYFKTTVRIWISVPDTPGDVTAVQSQADKWAQRIKDWLTLRWVAGGQLAGNRAALSDLFTTLANINGITQAQIVEERPDDCDIKLGVLRHYA